MPRRSQKKRLSKKAKGKQPMPSEDKEVEETTTSTVPIDLNDLPPPLAFGSLHFSDFPLILEPASHHDMDILVVCPQTSDNQTSAAPSSSLPYPHLPPRELLEPLCQCPLSPTGSSLEPDMTGKSTSEVPSGSRSEKSDGDLPDWADTMLEKINLLSAEFHKLRDMYRESQREVLLLQFKLSLVTQIDRMRDFEKALTRVAPGYFTSEEFDSADLEMFAEYLLAKQHADNEKRADDNKNGKKE